MRERNRTSAVKDHRCKLPEYGIWTGMRQRCENAKSRAYRNYGAKGITICEEWKDFTTFYADMGPRPSSSHSVERIDGTKGYDKTNCVWATPTEQARNTTQNVYVILRGVSTLLVDAKTALGINGSHFSYYFKKGWTHQQVVDHHAERKGVHGN